MDGFADKDYFWIYTIAGVVFIVFLVFVLPKIIRFLDKTVDQAAEEKKKRKDAAKAAAEKKNHRYKTF